MSERHNLRNAVAAAVLLLVLVATLAVGCASVVTEHGHEVDLTQVMGVTDGGIPTPLIDGAFYYLGNGHFSRAKGEDFYWRDGHFVNPDGSPLEVPEAVKQILRDKGSTGEITQPGSP